MNTKLNDKNIAAIAAVIILVIAFYLFGMIGVRTLISIFLIFILPVYMLLSRFNLDVTERLLFSLGIGLGVFSLVIWYIDRIIPSLVWSTIIAIIISIIIGFYLKLTKKPV